MTDPSSPPHHPFQDLLGFDVGGSDGRGEASITVVPEHLNPNGMVHGAVPYALIDTAMGAATMSVVPAGSWCATIEIHVRYLKPCTEGTLHATATVRRAGRRIVHLDAAVVTDDGTEIIAATGSFAVIAG